MNKPGDRLEPCVPLPLSEKILVDIADCARDWALMHGACMRDRLVRNFDTVQFAPFSLFPSPFPRSEFQKVCRLQPVLNELVHSVANDDEFLEYVLAEISEVDEFTQKLLYVYRTIKAEPEPAQPVTLAVLRSDVMLDTECDKVPFCSCKQVEINTIASGFGYLGPAAKDLQCYVLKTLGYHNKMANMPDNRALWDICDGLAKAFDLFGVANAYLMFVVDDFNVNICDQRYHEFELSNLRPDISTIRKTLTEIYNDTTLNEKKQLVLLSDGRPIAVVYYRSGYDPRHYPTQKQWDARLRAEMSSAIKCPSVQYHLAGTKKIQQALAVRSNLERFIRDPQQLEDVMSLFAGLYSLDMNEEGDRTVEMAIKNPQRYVLKPQREGGGNNLYDSDIATYLRAHRYSRDRTAYILMDLIRPPVTKGYIVRPKATGPPKLIDTVSELGIFGVIIGSKYSVIHNTMAGHMLRSKNASAFEGGVEAGVGAMDSPYLIDVGYDQRS